MPSYQLIHSNEKRNIDQFQTVPTEEEVQRFDSHLPTGPLVLPGPCQAPSCRGGKTGGKKKREREERESILKWLNFHTVYWMYRFLGRVLESYRVKLKLLDKLFRKYIRDTRNSVELFTPSCCKVLRSGDSKS